MNINYIKNPYISNDPASAKLFGFKQAHAVRQFHKTIPSYQPTPLYSLKNLAKELSVKNIYVKDESKRFGLNAFKGLGASYCIGRLIAHKASLPLEELTWKKLQEKEVRQAIQDMILVTATDGNHGRGIAWVASQLDIPAKVFLPKGSSLERLEHIQNLGAQAEITSFNYDDTVRLAASMEEEKGWTLIQDTAWPGYEILPLWIMQGYTTMAHEIIEQLQGQRPTHIFLQAGVGSFAGALTGFFTDTYQDTKPKIVIVEPEGANCLYQSVQKGTIQNVKELHTIMAGLSCGQPCTLGWSSLKNYADFFLSVKDLVTARGMRLLAHPIGQDPQIISGESGAVTTGLAAQLLYDQDLDTLRQSMELNTSSTILCISTEGDTDHDSYQKIIENGSNLHP
ncbi:MAG: diaminopropionate ammonia-lyase [Erysipelotrichaceae bacterium]|nr:diaminopropionate ammonia-lyase [Erysipelotrichaceae bacterium]